MRPRPRAVTPAYVVLPIEKQAHNFHTLRQIPGPMRGQV